MAKFLKFNKNNFSSLTKQFKLSNKDLKELDNLCKANYVSYNKSKLVKIINIILIYFI